LTDELGCIFFAAPLLRQKGESKSIRSGDRCSTIVLGRSNGGRHKHETGKDDGSVGDVKNLSSPKMKCLGRNTTNFPRPLCLLLYIDTPIWKSKFGAKSDVLCAGAEEPEAANNLGNSSGGGLCQDDPARSFPLFAFGVPSGYVKIAIENGQRNSEFSH